MFIDGIGEMTTKKMIKYIIDNKLYYDEEDGDYFIADYREDTTYVSVFELDDDELASVIKSKKGMISVW